MVQTRHVVDVANCETFYNKLIENNSLHKVSSSGEGGMVETVELSFPLHIPCNSSKEIYE